MNISASKTRYRITPRKVSIDWRASQELLWIAEDAFGSHWGNTFHYLLTQGEKFFCRALRDALPLIKDPKLREDVEAFIAQEAIHSAAHHQAIKQVLKPLAVEGGLFERQNAWLFDALLVEKPFGITLPGFMQHQWLVMRVGIVAAIEHFTATLGAYLLEEVRWDEHGANPVIADLYRWHGAEEVEHRCVAYDVYEYLGGGWPLRVLLMGLVFPLFMERQASGILTMASHAQPAEPKGWLSFIKHWRQSAKKQNVPTGTWFIKKTLRYLSPAYHPVKEASTEMALAYLANSMAVQNAQQA